MIKFTIITCTYNAAEVIKPTLDSILNQTWAPVEHLIIDGASKDDTVKVAEAYRQRSLEEETEHEVRIISEPDRGLYDAMNKGLRLATGDYVVFLNSKRLAARRHNTREDIQRRERTFRRKAACRALRRH